MVADEERRLDVSQVVAQLDDVSLREVDAALTARQRQEVCEELMSLEIERRLGVLEFVVDLHAP